MIILDTNVISALMRRKPDTIIVDWLDKQPRMSIWTTSITVLEIQFGLQIMPEGKRQSQLIQSFSAMLDEMGQRVAVFDAAAARQAGDLMASRKKKGRPVELRDTMIAGIALSHHATLATGNTAHFCDLSVPLIDPWA